MDDFNVYINEMIAGMSGIELITRKENEWDWLKTKTNIEEK